MKSDPANQDVTVYTPDSTMRRPGVLLQAMWRDLLASRELAWRLASRDISAQYRQAMLGLLWVFILPLANTAVWIFLHFSGVVVAREAPLPYPVYVLSGTMLWAVFMDAASAPLQKATAAKPMLAKLNFPREAIVLSGIYQSLFGSAIKMVVLLAVIGVLHDLPGWSILLLPLGILALVLAGTALGLLLTPLGLLYSDVGKGLPLLMQFLMFLTPAVLVAPAGSLAEKIFAFNPVTPLLVTSRAWLTGLPLDQVVYFLCVSVAMLPVLFVAWVIYRIAMPILVERMSA